MAIDDWIAAEPKAKRTVKFEKPAFGDHAPEHWLRCDLNCYHQGNYVSAHACAPTSGDAFLKAVEQISRTIGRSIE